MLLQFLICALLLVLALIAGILVWWTLADMCERFGINEELPNYLDTGNAVWGEWTTPGQERGPLEVINQ